MPFSLSSKSSFSFQNSKSEVQIFDGVCRDAERIKAATQDYGTSVNAGKKRIAEMEVS
jgi:hypothetical protein